MKPLLIISSLAILLISCSNSKNIFIKKEKNVIKKEKMILKHAELGSFPMKSDSLEILEVTISENIMHLKIAYSGGCEKHEFSLIGSNMISKSLPPIRSIKLIHNSNNDQCKKYLIHDLDIDISNLAYKKTNGSDIILRLSGWKKRIIYTYN